MYSRLLMIMLLFAFLVCCKEEVSNEYNSSIIERDEIDAAFNKDVSALLFDHLYVVVDSITYEALTKNSTWKNRYAFMDTGLPDFSSHQGNESTCYMRGHRHYIEILGPNNTYNEPVGKSGIGFSLNNDDEHFHLGVMPKLKETNKDYLSASEIVSMPFGTNESTWFKAFYTPSPGTALHTWYAFYNPGFLDSLHQENHSTYTREAFLKTAYKENRLFNQIHAIHLECTMGDYERIAQELRHLGCKLLAKKGEELIIESGDVSVHLQPSNSIEFSRITRLECHLNSEDNSVTQLGNLTITNKGKNSVWELDELYE